MLLDGSSKILSSSFFHHEIPQLLSFVSNPEIVCLNKNPKRLGIFLEDYYFLENKELTPSEIGESPEAKQ